MSDIRTILETIQTAVNKLSAGAAAKQDPVYKAVVNQLQKLETRNGAILNNAKNLKLIINVKNNVEKLIIDKKYKEQLKEFARAYNDVAGLQNQYFAQFAAKFTPSKALKALLSSAIQTTITNLTETGIEAGVTDGLKKIMLQNAQSGSSIADLTDQLRKYLLTDNTNDGALLRYTKTYATTAINQFSAEYNKSVADDLGLEWYMYDGSLLETSREFCKMAVKLKYIHVSEFEALLRGDFGDLGKIPVSKKTGLPTGLMEGTNVQNFPRRRGGWNCGHQLITVHEMVVPQNRKDEVYASPAYQNWALHNGKEVKKPSGSVKAFVNEETVKSFAKVNPKTFSKLTQPTPVHINSGGGTYYNPNDHTVHLDTERGSTEYIKQMITYHEFGHAVHIQNKILTHDKVSPEFQKVFDDCKKAITRSQSEIETNLVLAYRQSMSDGWGESASAETKNHRENIGMTMDMLGAITFGRYGGGHTPQYYRQYNGAYMELFAHGNVINFMNNDVAEKYMPGVVEVLKKYFNELYQQ